MDFNVFIPAAGRAWSIRFEHKLNKEDLNGFAQNQKYNGFIDMVTKNAFCTTDEDTERFKSIINSYLDESFDDVEDYIKYDLCVQREFEHYLSNRYQKEAFEAFNNWIDDQIDDFGREYFMLEV